MCELVSHASSELVMIAVSSPTGARQQLHPPIIVVWHNSRLTSNPRPCRCCNSDLCVVALMTRFDVATENIMAIPHTFTLIILHHQQLARAWQWQRHRRQMVGAQPGKSIRSSTRQRTGLQHEGNLRRSRIFCGVAVGLPPLILTIRIEAVVPCCIA